jgi:hypothetical protein
MKWCWILLKAFSACFEMIKWSLSLLLLMCCITFIDLHMLNKPLHPWDEAYLVEWMIFLLCCWIRFAIILLRIFASMFIKGIGL